MIARILFIFLTTLLTPLALAADLAGFWQHEELPAWIEVTVEDGVAKGTVVRNDEYPERVGRVLLKDLAPDPDQADIWQGQVYAERFEEYRDAQVSLPADDQMEITVKVGFMSRTVNWNRVAELPAD
jgi:hypothetical protein